MSSASSNQSVIHDRADYKEVYPSHHKDQESSSKERSPSTSPSEDVLDDGEEQPIKSVVGADGFFFRALPL